MEKQPIREQVWDDLEDSGVARFPFPPHDRIPNFAGAADAADRLADTDEWHRASVLKCNPDAPQLPVRRRALKAGKTLYVAVPRLREEACFLELDPATIEDVDAATTVSGISEYGTPVGPDALPQVDVIVSGSVAVTPAGVRVGKGEGYSDLEFAILREFDRVDDETPVATTIHERQRLDVELAADAHDVPIDLLVTPEDVARPDTGVKPAGLDWEALSAERVGEIPILARLQN